MCVADASVSSNLMVAAELNNFDIVIVLLYKRQNVLSLRLLDIQQNGVVITEWPEYDAKKMKHV